MAAVSARQTHDCVAIDARLLNLQFVSPADGVHAVARAKLAAQAFDVVFYRHHTQLPIIGDFLIAESGTKTIEHVLLVQIDAEADLVVMSRGVDLRVRCGDLPSDLH